MGIRGDIEADYHAALAALAWQIDLGATEALGEHPICAYDLPEKPQFSLRSAPMPALAPAPVGAPARVGDTAAHGAAALDIARKLAEACPDLPALDSAAAAFEGCELRRGARASVAGMGAARAAVVIICDPPAIEAEKAACALIPAEAQLLDSIFAAIGLSFDATNPDAALHLAPALPWPLRGAADLQAEALRLMQPFTLRRIALVQPKLVVVMGHFALAQVLPNAVMGRARGQWHDIEGAAPRAYPMQMPSAVMKTPQAKREAWADALAIKAALRGL